MDILSNFTETLKELLNENSLTPEKFEQISGFSASNTYKWLRGVAIPNLQSLVYLSDYFHCSLDFVCGRNSLNQYTTPKPMPPFSAQLTKLMKEKNLSGHKLSKLSKVPRTSLHNWLSGSSLPLLDNLVKLATYFDCTIDCLVGRE